MREKEITKDDIENHLSIMMKDHFHTMINFMRFTGAPSWPSMDMIHRVISKALAFSILSTEQSKILNDTGKFNTLDPELFQKCREKAQMIVDAEFITAYAEAKEMEKDQDSLIAELKRLGIIK